MIICFLEEVANRGLIVARVMHPLRTVRRVASPKGNLLEAEGQEQRQNREKVGFAVSVAAYPPKN